MRGKIGFAFLFGAGAIGISTLSLASELGQKIVSTDPAPFSKDLMRSLAALPAFGPAETGQEEIQGNVETEGTATTLGFTPQASTECLVGDAFKAKSGQACKFVITIVKADTTMPGKDIFNLPTALVIGIFEQLPGIGYVVGQAFAQESKRSFVATLRPPPVYESYAHCSHSEVIHSANSAVNHRWRMVQDSYGQYQWGLKSRGQFGGRSWFKADVIWKAVHPEYRDTARANKECV